MDNRQILLTLLVGINKWTQYIGRQIYVKIDKRDGQINKRDGQIDKRYGITELRTDGFFL